MRDLLKKGSLGARDKRKRIAGRAASYILLISIGFVYLYPILKMFSRSLMGPFDIANPLVDWVPMSVDTSNYARAFNVLGGFKPVVTSVLSMLAIALAQTFSSAFIAYGFSKFEFRGRMLLFALMIATFVLPTEITFLSKYVMFKNYGLLHSVFTVLLPSVFGQGLRQALFILIFYQFYNMSPKSLDEAATIDGAGVIKTFLQINLKMATPAIVVVFVFSFVWNWNETATYSSFFGDSVVTLPIALERFQMRFKQMYPSNFQGSSISNIDSLLTQGLMMAGTLISIVPLVGIYILCQRKLVESFDKAGITGE